MGVTTVSSSLASSIGVSTGEAAVTSALRTDRAGIAATGREPRRGPIRSGSASRGAILPTLAGAVIEFRALASESWRLQSLTPLDSLPDYDEPYQRVWGGEGTGAPVEADGRLFYRVPQGFAQAKNDGERWRWALAQAVEADAGQLNTARYEMANFLLGQFGTQTLAGVGLPATSDDGRPRSPAPYALDKLRDEETIARLATGVKRFTLPDEFNPIKIYQAIADDPRTGHGETPDATGVDLPEPPPARPGGRKPQAGARTLRRSEGWKASSSTRSSAPGDSSSRGMTQPAGHGATVDFRFRNGRRVQFEAQESCFEKLLGDVKE